MLLFIYILKITGNIINTKMLKFMRYFINIVIYLNPIIYSSYYNGKLNSK